MKKLSDKVGLFGMCMLYSAIIGLCVFVICHSINFLLSLMTSSEAFVLICIIIIVIGWLLCWLGEE